MGMDHLARIWEMGIGGKPVTTEKPDRGGDSAFFAAFRDPEQLPTGRLNPSSFRR
ncbi:MAG: hypothetical protein CM15mP125_0760 [Gammaproteobacteria bacterium]|nr:MAG: hypothetical protein CM15mP125_0760 [Gammaproteobacteria bacterium]